eukprot:326373_1
MSLLTWSQLVTVAVTSFVCTLSGLYLQHHLTTFISSSHKQQSPNPKPDKNKNKTASKSRRRATQFWDTYHCDDSTTTEWLADWTELKSFILSQITKILNQNKDTHPIAPSDLKILMIGNGLSEIPIHLYHEGYTNITVTDVSPQAIQTMKQKHSTEQYPHLKWLVLDCTHMSSHFSDSSFDLVFEKGVSDTLQYRRPTKESNILLQQMFSQIARVLNKEYGKYLCVSPRRKVPLLRLSKFNWSVKRMQSRTFDPDTVAHGKEKRWPFVYVHVCTIINAHNHLMVIKRQQKDRRKRFEQGTEVEKELQRLDLTFEPVFEITVIEKDVICPFKHYEEQGKDEEGENERNSLRLKG